METCDGGKLHRSCSARWMDAQVLGSPAQPKALRCWPTPQQRAPASRIPVGQRAGSLCPIQPKAMAVSKSALPAMEATHAGRLMALRT